MTAAVTYVDELVKDYLIFRGFIGSIKALEVDMKNEKEHSYQVDKIVEQLTNFISSYDLNFLRETWHHLDKRIFSRCELGSANSVAGKLETALLKMYVVNCISSNKHEKLMEFYEKMSSELQGQAEWKDWFAIPFMKSPDEHPTYSMYFTRQWMETMLVSLHNFISVSLHTMSVPALLAYEDEQAQISALKEENEMLKLQIVALKQSQNITSRLSENYSSNFVGYSQSRANLMDDFFVIAQEPQAADNQIKGIKSIIRNIGSGLPISPILSRRPHSVTTSKASSDVTTDVVDSAITLQMSAAQDLGGSGYGGGNQSTFPAPRQVTKADKKSSSSPAHSSVAAKLNTAPSSKQRADTKPLSSSPKTARARNESEFQKKKTETKGAKSENTLLITCPEVKPDMAGKHEQIIEIDKVDPVQSPYLLLSQEEFVEHHSVVTHCKFNVSGSILASSDLDGVIKIWSPNPTPKTISTIVSRSSIMSLEWANKGDQMLLYGNKNGIIRLYDIQDKKTVTDLYCDAKNSLKDYSILCIASSPLGASFAASTSHNKIASSDKSKLLYCDLKTMKIQRILNMNKAPTATFNCCTFNHNGQLVLGGTSDGRLTMFDVRCNGCIASWNCHENVAVNTIQFSADETSCFSLGENNEFNKWSVNKTGVKLCQFQDSMAAAPRASNLTGKLFSLHSEKNLVLMHGQSGGILKQLHENVMTPVLNLGGHKAPVVTVDWSTAMDCGMCVTGSVDGRIRVSTLLAH